MNLPGLYLLLIKGWIGRMGGAAAWRTFQLLGELVGLRRCFKEAVGQAIIALPAFSKEAVPLFAAEI